MAAAALSLASNTHASEASCEKINDWSQIGWEAVKNERGGFHLGPRIIKVLEDEQFIPVFHKSLTDFGESDLEAMQTRLNQCYQVARKMAQEASKAGDRKTVNRIGNGNKFISISLRPQLKTNMPSNFKNTMLNQQANLVKRKEALAETSVMLGKAKGLIASQSNISTLNSMKQGTFLTYLDKLQKQQYLDAITALVTQMSKKLAEQQIASLDQYEDSLAGLELFLQNQQGDGRRANRRQTRRANNYELEQATHAKMQRLSEAAISDAVEQLDDFDNSLKGLKSLVAFYTKVDMMLKRAKAMGKYKFTKAYKSRLDAIASDSIDEFKQFLSDYSVSQDNLKKINRSVQVLFTQQPLPSNIEQFRKVALLHAETMKVELSKQVCYQSISKDTIDSDKMDIGLLDSKGASTLGLFVCQLTDNGHQLVSYESPGFIGNTHVLKVKTPRGITLTLSFEPLEVNDGEELLVGITAKDAGQEVTFTLSQWQDYAQQFQM